MYDERHLGLRNSAMQCARIDKGFNKSPLNRGQSDVGVEGIRIKLINYPDEAMLKLVLGKMVKATTGSDIDEPVDAAVAEELFRGGLQTGLEAGVFSFEISGCSRAMTHELVRTRQATFHQQSMRHTDMGDRFNVREPETIATSTASVVLEGGSALQRAVGLQAQQVTPHEVWIAAVDVARAAYAAFKRADIPYQDARNVCPIGTQTYIIATYPIKVFLDTFAYRACNMMMWEIVWVFRRMRDLVVERFPWMAPYIRIGCERTRRCVFQGWEATQEQCDGGGTGEPYPWVRDRTFESKYFGG